MLFLNPFDISEGIFGRHNMGAVASSCCGSLGLGLHSENRQRERALLEFRRLHLPTNGEELSEKLESGGETGADVTFDKWRERSEDFRIDFRVSEPPYPGLLAPVARSSSDVVVTYKKMRGDVRINETVPFVSFECHSAEFSHLKRVYKLGLNTNTFRAVVDAIRLECGSDDVVCTNSTTINPDTTVVEFEQGTVFGGAKLVEPPCTVMARLQLRRKGNSNQMHLVFIVERMASIQHAIDKIRINVVGSNQGLGHIRWWTEDGHLLNSR